MPVVDQEDYPNDLANGSSFKGAVPFDYAAVDGGSQDVNARLDVLEALMGWIRAGDSKSRNCYPAKLPQRLGLRVVAMMWVMHPDRMPWAMGRALSENEVASALGIAREEFSRVAADVTRRFDLRNGYQSHGRWSRGSKPNPKRKT